MKHRKTRAIPVEHRAEAKKKEALKRGPLQRFRWLTFLTSKINYSDLTFFTIAAASMPKAAINSAAWPERGMPFTASL